MGFAVAQAAQTAGHEVTLIAGPVSLKTPRGVQRVDVVSARDMFAAVRNTLKKHVAESIALVMTAAVADWRPAKCASKKLKKSQMDGTLRLVRNPDILNTLNRTLARSVKERLVRVGFAAETGNPTKEAMRKCREKGLDFIVANDVSRSDSGFGTRTNRVNMMFRDGRTLPLPLMSKLSVARRIVREIILLAKANGN